MCDYIPGELLVCHHKDDVAGRRIIEAIRSGDDQRFMHVQFIESLDEKLERVALTGRENLVSQFFRLGVPTGQEGFKANILQHHYKRAFVESLLDHAETQMQFLLDSHHHFHIVPNSILTPCFTFAKSKHVDYKKLFGWSGSSSTTRTILIADSGVASTGSFNITARRNFVDHSKRNDVTDDHKVEHGTAIAEIITDMCPNANLVIYKVVDASSRASEWDTLAALGARSGADVINLSLAFGLADVKCPHCGRESHGSRSAVFENMVEQVVDAGSVILAAAGNKQANELAFPARYRRAVAIESVNENLDLSGFSNHSTADQDGNAHPRVFVLPGGEKLTGASPSEWVGTATNGTDLWGTSFATAYASAIVADAWDQSAHSSKSADQMVDWLASNADRSMASYVADFGNGLMKA